MGGTIWRGLRNFIIAALCLATTASHSYADTSALETAVFAWLVDGVNPQAPGNPYCATDSSFLLGHLSRNAPEDWIETPLASLCRTFAHPTTGALPPVIYACYTTDAPNDDFNSYLADERLCICDYFLCDPGHQQPFEEAVGFAVKLAGKLGFN
jgi:hypothetical protein